MVPGNRSHRRSQRLAVEAHGYSTSHFSRDAGATSRRSSSRRSRSPRRVPQEKHVYREVHGSGKIPEKPHLAASPAFMSEMRGRRGSAGCQILPRIVRMSSSHSSGELSGKRQVSEARRAQHPQRQSVRSYHRGLRGTGTAPGHTPISGPGVALAGQVPRRTLIALKYSTLRVWRDTEPRSLLPPPEREAVMLGMNEATISRL